MAVERPWIDFAEVKAKVSIPDVLEVFGIAGRFRPSKDGLVGACPIPQHKHGPRPNENQFRIDCRKGLYLYRCFGDCAGTPLGGGDVIRFVQAMTGLSDAHVRFWFADHFGERLGETKSARSGNGPSAKEEAREVVQTPRRAENQDTTEILPSEKPALKPLRFRLNLNPDVPYLRQRGVPAEIAARYGIGLCSRGLLAGYVAIPVFRYPPETPGENPVAYLGRWPGDAFEESADRPRYKWPTGFEKTRVVYALNEAVACSDGCEPLILVEGCFAVWHLVGMGYTTAVASFGASLSDEQAALLIGTRRPVIVMFDGDAAGRQGQQDAIGRLIPHTLVRSIHLPDGIQPDDLSGDELAWLLPS